VANAGDREWRNEHFAAGQPALGIHHDMAQYPLAIIEVAVPDRAELTRPHESRIFERKIEVEAMVISPRSRPYD
jgi:hypothetical protein